MATGTNEGKRQLCWSKLVEISNDLTLFFGKEKRGVLPHEFCKQQRKIFVKGYSKLKTDFYCTEKHEQTLFSLAIKVVEFYSEDVELLKSPHEDDKEKSDALLEEIEDSIIKAFIEKRIYSNFHTFYDWAPSTHADADLEVRHFLSYNRSIRQSKRYCSVDRNNPILHEPTEMFIEISKTSRKVQQHLKEDAMRPKPNFYQEKSWISLDAQKFMKENPVSYSPPPKAKPSYCPDVDRSKLLLAERFLTSPIHNNNSIPRTIAVHKKNQPKSCGDSDDSSYHHSLEGDNFTTLDEVTDELSKTSIANTFDGPSPEVTMMDTK